MSAPPTQYHALGPFEKFFQTGLPVLMYHKIGARPRRVRLKGLYLGTALFARQLAELREAGYRTPPLAEVLQIPGNPGRQIILSFDDGFRNVFQNALPLLRENRMRAIQFLVPTQIGKQNEWDLREGEAPEALMDASEIREWLAAGNEIGSHSMSHARLTRLSVRDAREEIGASKKQLEDLFGLSIEHFCYPYGDYNVAVRDLVAEAGYRTACSTQFGVNTPATSPFELRRITARYPSRSLKSLRARLLK